MDRRNLGHVVGNHEAVHRDKPAHSVEAKQERKPRIAEYPIGSSPIKGIMNCCIMLSC